MTAPDAIDPIDAAAAACGLDRDEIVDRVAAAIPAALRALAARAAQPTETEGADGPCRDAA